MKLKRCIIKNKKKNSKFFGAIGCSLFVIPLIALLIYLSPGLLLWGAFALTDVEAKIYSQQNITEIINDPEKKGAEIHQEEDSMSLSWETLSTPMTNVKNASVNDLERLAKSVYGKTDYDRCVVKKEKLGSKVDFYRKEHLIYTVFFTGN